MPDYLVTEKNLGSFMEYLAQGRVLYVPQGDGDDCCLQESDGKNVNLNFTNTHMSPKSVFFPQTEPLMGYSKNSDQKDTLQYKEFKSDGQTRVIFGLRPCDAKGLLVSANVFNNNRFTDPYWQEKYENTIKIALACKEPVSSQCFCTLVGGSPFGESGLDILAHLDKTDLWLKCLTKKGEELLADAPMVEKVENSFNWDKAKEAAEALLPSKDDKRFNLKADVLELFNASHWQTTAAACLNCGVCTFICPTCHCFDIQDEQNEKGGIRMRNWDSCMSPLFTLHGTGHNPRPDKTSRLRQRFMHKLKYIPLKQDGALGCTGCGRCVTLCPVNIDIRAVAQTMSE